MLPPLDCILLPVVFSVEQKDCGRTNINGSVRQDYPFIAEAIPQMQRFAVFHRVGCAEDSDLSNAKSLESE